MNCANCGAAITPGAANCGQCGAAVQLPPIMPYAVQPAHVPNYLVWSILCTVLCCLPGGIVAIIHAAQVNGHLQSGNYAAAQAASAKARKWCWVSFIVGLVFTVLYIFMVFAGIIEP